MGSKAYERTFLGIAIAVAAVWVISTLVQVAVPSHPVPVSVNAVMGVVATSFFGGALVIGRRDSNGKGEPVTLSEATVEAAKKRIRKKDKR